MRQPLLY